MSYNYVPQKSTGMSTHRTVYGEEMLLPTNIMTEDLANEEMKEHMYSEYLSELRTNMSETNRLVRENLKQASQRQRCTCNRVYI